MGEGPRGAAIRDGALLSSELTSASTILGTPAYMAPEQFLGQPTDARTDQFSFCAVLWEAVYRGRAFPGSSFAELRRAVTGGHRAPPMTGRRVPGWLYEAMARGLAVAPEERWPSMHALLDELTHRSARIRRRRAATACATIVVVAGLGYAGYRYQLARVAAACEREGAAIEEVWPGADGGARARLREAITQGGESFARETADRLMPWLDQYADSWSRSRGEACFDERVRGTTDAATRARVDWCLDERRFALDAFIDEFEANDLDRLRAVVFSAARLPRVEPCADVELQTRRPTPPPERRDELHRLYAGLSHSRALDRHIP